MAAVAVSAAAAVLLLAEGRPPAAEPRMAAQTRSSAQMGREHSGLETLENGPANDPASPGGGGLPQVVVALDPGHGGTNLGAAGAERGLYEKWVTLALAERIRGLLTTTTTTTATGGPAIVVVLCREADVLVPIRARARCARESGARAFISLHANAVPSGVRPGSQHGFEVFVLGPREVEDDATLAMLGQVHDADAVWAAHEVRAAADQSIVLGRSVNDALTRVLGAEARRGIKQSGAALDVLRGTGTAAALVEVGFIDHPGEGARLATAEGREPIALALAEAIRVYVAANLRTPEGARASADLRGAPDGHPSRRPRTQARALETIGE